MRPSGGGLYFDGVTSARHDVMVELEPAGLLIRAAEGHLLAQWPYGELEHLSAPDDMLRLGRSGHRLLARLEIRDSTLAQAIDEMAHSVDRSGTSERRGRRKVVAWSFAAVVSLVVVGIYGVPAIADRLAPLVPLSV